MIKRYYFFKAKTLWGDGTGSYSYQNKLFSTTSWFPDHENAFDKVLDFVTDEWIAKGKPVSSIEICAFNRV